MNSVIITTTRNRTAGLQRTIKSILADVRMGFDSYYSCIVVDDSSDESYRAHNIKIVQAMQPLVPGGILYFGPEQQAHFEKNVPPQFRSCLMANTKRLGAEHYDSVGPRNLGILLGSSFDYVFIIDDDVDIGDEALGNPDSALEAMFSAVAGDSDICGVQWRGIPDQSTLEHLDDQIYSQLDSVVGLPPSYDFPNRSPLPARDLGWSRVNPSYVTSGGGMVFKGRLCSVPFPRIFNDDWHWISYHHTCNSATIRSLDNYSFLNTPPVWRTPTLTTLSREAEGEIIFEAMHVALQDGVNAWTDSSRINFSSIVELYASYLGHLSRDVESLASKRTKPIPQSPFSDYNTILFDLYETQKFVQALVPDILRQKIDLYTASIGQWAALVDWFKEEGSHVA